MIKRYSKNVAGDFYVEDACCITCGVPLDIAPDIFEMDDEQCFVKKQPVTIAEIDQTVEAILCGEAECIRYGGNNLEILRRLAEVGEHAVCDDPQAYQFEIKPRLIVRMLFPAETSVALLAALSAEAGALKTYNNEPRYVFKPLQRAGYEAILEFAWFEDNFHMIKALEIGPEVFELRLRPLPSAWLGMARTVHAWLTSLSGVRDIWWMTEKEAREGGGQPTPY